MLPRSVYDPNQPQGSMSLLNLRNTLRALFMGDLMPLRPRASMDLDPMEYATDAQAQAAWAGTGVTVTKTTTKHDGNYALQCVVDATGDRVVSKIIDAFDLSAFKEITLWERCDAASSDIKFYLKDSDDNESYWDIQTNGTADTWQQDILDLTTPDSNNGASAELDDVVEWGFIGLDANQTYIFDTIKALCGLNVSVEGGLLAGFYQQVYLGDARVTFTGGGSPQITPPATNPRIDLLVLNSDNELEWVEGTEASSPAEPDFPSGNIPICLVYCRAGMVKVVDYEDKDANPTEGHIYKDVRPGFVRSVLTFIGLTDAPSSYSGQAGKSVVVNTGETALEFKSVPDINSQTEKTSLSNNDIVLIEDSQASYVKKKVKYSNLQIGIAGLSEKTSPVDDDLFLIEDSEASNAKKKVKKSNIIPSGIPRSRFFTSNGTFVAPSGVTKVFVTMVGGGGGGGGGGGSHAGGGGGSGAYIIRACYAVTPGNSYSVVVGGGGNGGGADTTGGTGGTTSFDTLSINGGSGGRKFGSGGSGGSGGAATGQYDGYDGKLSGIGGNGGGLATTAGGKGGNGAGDVAPCGGGGGGGNPFGKGGRGGDVGQAGFNATNYGSGGGGGGSGSKAGGKGASGFVLVEYFV